MIVALLPNENSSLNPFSLCYSVLYIECECGKFYRNCVILMKFLNFCSINY